MNDLTGHTYVSQTLTDLEHDLARGGHRMHLKWVIATLVLAALATAGYLATPTGSTGSTWHGLLFGISGSGLMLFAGLLPLGKKLARWKIVRLETLQRGHIWLGLLSVLLVLFHAGFRRGGQLSTALLVVLAAIIVSGIAGLFLQHLLVLCKEGKTGKGKTAAAIISVSHKVTVLLHIPLAASLLVLGIVHAMMSLYF
jgi:hypothetical protein